MFVRSLEKLPDFNPDLPLFLDTETDGFYGEVRLIQLYQPEAGEPVLIDTLTFDDDLQKLKSILNDKWIVCHNATYDMYVMRMNPARLDDTLYLARMAYPTLKEYSLDKVCFALGYYDLYKGMEKAALQKSNFSMTNVLSIEQMTYAKNDVIALSKIWPHLQKAKDIKAYQLDMLSMKYSLRYMLNGIPVNKALVQGELRMAIEEEAAVQHRLGDLNVNSPKQCKAALGTDSTNEDELIRLVSEGGDRGRLAQDIYDLRRIKKRITMLNSYNYDRVYSIFNVGGAVTGRFTAKGKDIPQGINAQQIPRRFKHLFVSTNPDLCVIEADYSTLELRLAATIFEEPVMAQQLIDGKDLHTEVARLLTGKEEITKEDRFRAKAVNFGFVYGMSAPSFQKYALSNYNLRLTLEEAREWRNKYFSMYKQIANYHKYIWENYKNAGFTVSTPLGRAVAPKLGTDAINIPVQGAGAECTKLAVHYMVKTDPEVLGKIVNVVHDSIKLEVPVVDKHYWSTLLESCMLKAWDEMNKCDAFKIKGIPMKVEVEIHE